MGASIATASPSMRLGWYACCLAALMVVFGCNNEDVTGAVGQPFVAPAMSIQDGVHESGNPHFFFLPPLVASPTYAGPSDSGESPVVRVCEWDGTTCTTDVADFSMTSGSGAQTVRYDETAQQYQVNWDTKTCVWGGCTLDTTKAYRLQVLVAGTELGHADVKLVGNGSGLKNVNTDAYVGLVDGRTLPVKFRIEQGAVYVLQSPPPGDPPTLITTADGNVTISVPSGALQQPVGVTVDAAPVPPRTTGARLVAGSVLDFGPSGTQFAQPVTVTVKYDPTTVPAGRLESSLRLYTRANGAWDLVRGSSVDPVTHTVSGAISHFSEYSVQSMRRIGLSVCNDEGYGCEYAIYSIYLINEDDTGLQLFRDGARSPSWSPDGTQMAFQCWSWDATCPDGQDILMVRDLATDHERVAGGEVQNYGGLSARLSWSPDGTRIGYHDPVNGWIAAADGVTPPVEVVNPEQYVCCLSWSPDGTQLSFFADHYVSSGVVHTGLYVVSADARSGLQHVRDNPDGLVEWSEGWTSDGSKLLIAQHDGTDFGTGPVRYTLATYDMTSHEVVPIVQDVTNEGFTPFDLDFGLIPDGSKVSFFAFGAAGDNRPQGCIWTVDLVTHAVQCVVDGAIINAVDPNLHLTQIEGWEP